MATSTHIDYEAIKLNCRICRTSDAGTTSKVFAMSRGWSDIEPVDQPMAQMIHQWWTHLGNCPDCIHNYVVRQEENPVTVRTTRRLITNGAMVATILAGLLALWVGGPAKAAPDGPAGNGGEQGACCLGPGDNGVYVVDLTSTRAQCHNATRTNGERGGVFIKGTFSDTDAVSPCDLLPGGD